MSITITDPALLAQLAALSGTVEVRRPDGDSVGTFRAKATSPISDEELDHQQQFRDGKPPLPRF